MNETKEINRGLKEIQIVLDAIYEHGIVAGGYARYCLSPKINLGLDNVVEAGDVDIFCFTENDYEPIKQNLLAKNFIVKIETDYAVSFDYIKSDNPKPKTFKDLVKQTHVPDYAGPPVQLIKPLIRRGLKTFGHPEEIIDNFDFSVIKAGIVEDVLNRGSYIGLVNINFDKDEIDNRIVIGKVVCPINQVLRLVKYGKKGYQFSMGEVMKILNAWDQYTPEIKTQINEMVNKLDFDTEKGYISNLDAKQALLNIELKDEKNKLAKQ